MNKIIFTDKYDTHEHDKINKLDYRVIDFDHWCTVLPISDKLYRRANPTKASVSVSFDKSGYVSFTITDDWGDVCYIDIPAEFRTEIASAILSYIENGLCEIVPSKTRE